MWTDNELTIIIEGRRDDWPGGPRTLTPCTAGREPNGRTLWFGAELDSGNQVWFRITTDALDRMREATPRARGERLVDAAGARRAPRRRPPRLADARPGAQAGDQPIRGAGFRGRRHVDRASAVVTGVGGRRRPPMP